MQKIHHGPNFEKSSFENSADVFSYIHYRTNHLKQRKNVHIPLAELEAITNTVHQSLASHLSIAPCHNDLNPNNLMFYGNEFKVIDYETAAQGEPYFDLATIAIFYCTNLAQEYVLLSTYLEHKPSVTEQKKLYLMKQIVQIVFAFRLLEKSQELLQQYDRLQVLSDAELAQQTPARKIVFSDEEALKFAKTMINQAIANSESQAFKNAIKQEPQL